LRIQFKIPLLSTQSLRRELKKNLKGDYLTLPRKRTLEIVKTKGVEEQNIKSAKEKLKYLPVLLSGSAFGADQAENTEETEMKP